MSKKLKRLSILLMSILLMVSLLPTTVFAAGKIDTEQLSSLNIYYQNSEKLIVGAKFDLYKVATIDDYSRMTLTAAFEPLKDKISGLADLENTEDDEAWRELARTLKSYESGFSGALIKSGEIGRDGNLKFDGLECGLYLVIGSRQTIGSYRYTVDPFMVFLPGIDKEDDEWVYDYDISVEPKSSRKSIPSDDDTVTRKVLKDWEPKEGVEHPSEVSVQLLRDGEVYETVTLNEKNNWRCPWNNLSDRYDWDVREVDVPDNYTVKISRSGITFIITNSYNPPDNPPDNPPPDDPTEPESEDKRPPKPSEPPEDAEYSIDDPEVPLGHWEWSEENGEWEWIEDPDIPLGNLLPQTGVLWWPVPVMLCLGIILLTLGTLCRRRDEK